MPILDFKDVQILLLELQPEIVASITTPSPAALRRAASAVREIAQALAIPVVASVFRVGEREATLIDELSGLTPLLRTEVSAFDNAEVRDRLAHNGRKILAIGGVSTEIALLHAVLDARRANYDVHILVDCCGGLSERTDAAALRHMELAGAHPSTVSSFFTYRSREAAPETSQKIMGALARLWSWKGAGEQDLAPDSAVAGLLNELRAAWRAGDATRFAHWFGHKASFVAFDGATLTGTEEISTYHKAPFETHLAGTELVLNVQEVRALASGVFLVSSVGGIVKDGPSHGELLGASAQTFVIARCDGQLRIEAFQNTRVRPITGSASAQIWKDFDRAWFAQERQQ